MLWRFNLAAVAVAWLVASELAAAERDASRLRTAVHEALVADERSKTTAACVLESDCAFREYCLLFQCTSCGGTGVAGDGCSVLCPCGSGYSCVAGSQTCMGPGQAGDSCSATRPCASGLNCVPGPQTCQAPGQQGDPCAAFNPCANGFACAVGSQTCQALRIYGDDCSLLACGPGLTCFQWVCLCTSEVGCQSTVNSYRSSISAQLPDRSTGAWAYLSFFSDNAVWTPRPLPVCDTTTSVCAFCSVDGDCPQTVDFASNFPSRCVFQYQTWDYPDTSKSAWIKTCVRTLGAPAGGQCLLNSDCFPGLSCVPASTDPSTGKLNPMSGGHPATMGICVLQ